MTRWTLGFLPPLALITAIDFAQAAATLRKADVHAAHGMTGQATTVRAPSQATFTQAEPVSETLPADADGALAALQRSPRRREYMDVTIPGSPTKTFVVYPEGRDKAPVVLVIHEISGLSDWVRAVADRFAKEGFIAVAPDLLSGMAPNGGGTDELGTQLATAAIRNLTPR